MPTPGRNDPCPCGSGKKYKKCCFLRDDAAPAPDRLSPLAPLLPPRVLGKQPGYTIVEDDIDQYSNRVVALIKQRRLDEAVHACEVLRLRYPDAIDWIERTAMIHEARGNLPEALEYWQRALAFMQENEGFDGQQGVQETIDRITATLGQRPPPTT